LDGGESPRRACEDRGKEREAGAVSGSVRGGRIAPVRDGAPVLLGRTIIFLAS